MSGLYAASHHILTLFQVPKLRVPTFHRLHARSHVFIFRFHVSLFTSPHPTLHVSASHVPRDHVSLRCSRARLTFLLVDDLSGLREVGALDEPR